MAGANDLKNGVPEAQIISNLQRTVRTLQQQHPQAQIVVYSVLPTRWPQIANDRVRSLNNQIAALTQQQAVDYRDVHAWFEDEWGELRQDLTTDGLHLNPQGYALWQRAILARAQ
jgi:lysophospholipase L1-like esterase